MSIIDSKIDIFNKFCCYNLDFKVDDSLEEHDASRKNNNTCQLRFIYWQNSGVISDYGKWKCCVSIINSLDKEICRDIELPDEMYHPPENIKYVY